ncbi:MAG: hypothetical protein DMG17_04105, partial [Acidobacteria bacterium]
ELIEQLEKNNPNAGSSNPPGGAQCRSVTDYVKPGRESVGGDSRESGRPEDSRRRTGVDSTKRRPGASTRSLYILNVACTIPPIPWT